MTSPSTTVRICQGLGITASSFLAGTLYAASTIAIPTILAPKTTPSLLLSQWHTIYRTGMKIGPTIALLGAVNYLSVAWGAYNSTYDTRVWKSYVAAAVGTIGIVPFTLIFMASTNNTLLAQVAKSTLPETEIRGLVENWAFLNLVRTGIPVVGTALGLYGAL
ncbi:MAG: hypothetical protein Q9223_003108 [Gallowayella weberi]